MDFVLTLATILFIGWLYEFTIFYIPKESWDLKTRGDWRSQDPNPAKKESQTPSLSGGTDSLILRVVLLMEEIRLTTWDV